MTTPSRTISESFTREQVTLLVTAERAWNRADDSLWDFAPAAAELVGLHVDGLTKALADRIGRKEDSVEGYAAAWRLWEKLLQHYPREAEIWRTELYIGHFIPVAKKWKSKWISLADAANFLQMAVNDHLSVDRLRNKLPEQGYGSFESDVKKAIRAAERVTINPRFKISERNGRAIVRAVKLLQARLDKVA